MAIAVNEDGYREVLGAAEGMKEDKSSWVSFFQWLRAAAWTGLNWWLETKPAPTRTSVKMIFPANFSHC